MKTGCSRARSVLVFAAGLATLLPLPSQAESGVSGEDVARKVAYPPISEIIFEGNRVTNKRILRQEMVIHEGDPADPALIERSRQAIMDLGLFVSVTTQTEEVAGGVVLRIQVKEKYYILPVPKANRDENGAVSIGAELTFDNLYGLNQQLKLRYETENASTVTNGEVVSYDLGYRYPRMFGTSWQVQTDLSDQTGPVEVVTNGAVTSVYWIKSESASLMLSRWYEQTGPSRGWQAGGGLVWRRNAYDYGSGAIVTDQFIDATAVGIAAQFGYTDTHDYLYSRSGQEYGYTGEYSSRMLGAESHYTRHEFYWRHYQLLDGSPHVNLDTQLRVGLSSGEMFLGDQYAYAIGGNKTLRGFESAVLTGNAFVVANVQYLRPLFGYLPLRGVLFADVGNAYPSNTEMHLGDLLWDVGLGLRLRLKSFVKIDLRLDVAYAPETGQTRVFLGTRDIF